MSDRETDAASGPLRLNFLSHGTLESTDLGNSRRFYEEFPGLDVSTRADKRGIKKVTRPLDQHGTYRFFICDPDDNWREILTNPAVGYSWMFERGEQAGRGNLDKDFARPAGIDETVGTVT